MANRSFVHLHCHTHYSLLDGASRIPELVQHVKGLGMNALAITDHGNLYGAIEFYRECSAAGLNPIIGYEAYVAPGKRTDREAKRRGEAGYHLTLLAKDNTGFHNLIKMSSIAFTEGYHYVPRIDKELLEAHSAGLICLSGCLSGEFSELLLKEQLDEAKKLAQWFARVFGRNFYIEIQNNGLDLQRECAARAIDLANQMGLPLVATSDAHYLHQADAHAHDVLLCINTGKTLKDQNRLRYDTNQFFVRGPEEMYQLFPGQEEAVQRSQEIANGVAIKLDFKARHFPVFTLPKGKKAEDYLRELCYQGLNTRYRGQPPQAASDRLEHELNIICRMGFASYFLIVWDFIRFAREHKIPASARGSACGALVSYVLGISKVNPLEYDLLFERFLDPNRSEAPDIDIDFCQERREEVIDYVKRKYGAESVAQIGTFGTLAAKAAIKDVGRVLDVPLERVNRLTALVPKTPGITLDDALEQVPDLRREYEADPTVRQLIDIARKLEGTNRNAGTHAAGVVIANGPIINFVPVQRVVRKGEDGNGKKDEAVITTQWPKDDIEKVGMLKMDFLGLRTLTMLDHCVKLIEQTRGEKIDLDNLPLDDPETYRLLQRGDARGVFQFESEGIRELIKRMKPDTIQDIIACTALYRPGPMRGGMHDAYVSRKHGLEPVVYQHPVMQEVLGQTFNIMVFQEDIMRILNRLGGIELSSAYACIKAISKKKQEIIDQRRADFIKGAQQRGLSQELAEEIFGLIVYFAGYGFNKSHSAAYAIVSYQTAYLKTHYTPEFLAALLSSEIEDGNKRDIMVEHFDDARRFGYPVQPPNINTDLPDFTVKDGKLLFGLVAIKGLGRAAANEIVRVRTENGPFRDLFDFCERLDLKIVSKAAIEKLIKAGAMDCFGAHRAQLWQMLPRALQVAADVQQERRLGQVNLFETMESLGREQVNGFHETLPDIPEWAPLEKLKYEKEVLDFYISSHPLAQYSDTLQRFSTHSVRDLASASPGQEVLIGGMLTSVRYMNTRKARTGNTRYLRCKLEDFSGSAECVMWPDDYDRFKELAVEDQICFAAATVEKAGTEPSLVIQKLLTVEQVQRERTTGLVLGLTLAEHTPEHIEAIARILKRTPGNVPVFLSITDRQGKRVLLKAGSAFNINPATLHKGELEDLLGPGKVHFSRQGGSNKRMKDEG